MNTPSAKPCDEIRLGTVKAAIWRNETDGVTRYNATLHRLYRDEEGRWRSSDSFGRDELLIVAQVAERAFGRVHELQQSERTEAAS